MTPKRQTRAFIAAGIAVALAAGANGCELIASFDRSLIPAEGGAEIDAAGNDASEDAPSAIDAPQDSTTDTGPAKDAGDAGDANVKDANVADTTADVADTNVADTSADVADTSVPDANDGGDAGDDAD